MPSCALTLEIFSLWQQVLHLLVADILLKFLVLLKEISLVDSLPQCFCSMFTVPLRILPVTDTLLLFCKLGVLLPELVVSIILLLTIDTKLMQETGSIPLLAGLLEHLDRFNHLAPGHERDDQDRKSVV